MSGGVTLTFGALALTDPPTEPPATPPAEPPAELVDFPPDPIVVDFPPMDKLALTSLPAPTDTSAFATSTFGVFIFTDRSTLVFANSALICSASFLSLRISFL